MQFYQLSKQSGFLAHPVCPLSSSSEQTTNAIQVRDKHFVILSYGVIRPIRSIVLQFSSSYFNCSLTTDVQRSSLDLVTSFTVSWTNHFVVLCTPGPPLNPTLYSASQYRPVCSCLVRTTVCSQYKTAGQCGTVSWWALCTVVHIMWQNWLTYHQILTDLNNCALFSPEPCICVTAMHASKVRCRPNVPMADACVELLRSSRHPMTGRLATHPSNTTVRYRCQSSPKVLLWSKKIEEKHVAGNPNSPRKQLLIQIRWWWI